MSNYMDRYLDWLESTTPEERLGYSAETRPACPVCGHKAHPETPMECQWCPEGYCDRPEDRSPLAAKEGDSR